MTSFSDDDFGVRLTCATCGGVCVRSKAIVDSPWVHLDDYVQLPDMTSAFDHEPVLNVVDTTLVEDIPAPPTIKINPWPFAT